MKKNTKKIVESILNGADIRKSLAVNEDAKDIARAEKLKTQDPKFAAKMSRSITDTVKWERRYQAIKDVCGEDSPQAKAFADAKPAKRLSENDIQSIVDNVQKNSKYGDYYELHVSGPDWDDYDPEWGLPSISITAYRSEKEPLPEIDGDYGEEFDNGGIPDSLEDLINDVSRELEKYDIIEDLWDGTDGVACWFNFSFKEN